MSCQMVMVFSGRMEQCQPPIVSEWSSVLVSSEAFLSAESHNQRGIKLIAEFVKYGEELGLDETFRSVLDALLFLVVPEQREPMIRYYAGRGRPLRYAHPAVILRCDAVVLSAINVLNAAWDAGWRASARTQVAALLDATDPALRGAGK